MTLSINCKDSGDPVCTHTMYGETEEELLKNAKEHGIRNMDILKKHRKKNVEGSRKVQKNNKIIIELFTVGRKMDMG